MAASILTLVVDACDNMRKVVGQPLKSHLHNMNRVTNWLYDHLSIYSQLP